MSHPHPASRSLITLGDLQRSGFFRFTFIEEGIERDAFLAWHDGKVVAYENLCRHLPLSLDYGDGQFFTPDRRHFVCQTHGAIYEPSSGLCIAGPCAGASLKPLAIQIIEGAIYFLGRPAPETGQTG